MKTKLLILLLLAGSSLFARTRVFVSVGIGNAYPGYYGPPPVYAYAPPPAYVWVPGYWDYAGPSRYWHAGYYSDRPYYRSVGPRYYAPSYNRRDYRRDYRHNGRHWRR